MSTSLNHHCICDLKEDADMGVLIKCLQFTGTSSFWGKMKRKLQETALKKLNI
jgi:hypothetical protein